MASEIGQQGYFSVLRWRSDATRDEARNVAVILVEAEGKFGGVKSAPLSTVSSRLQDQGLLDGMLIGLQKQFSEEKKPNLGDLLRMRESLQYSLYVTEPQPVAVPDVDAVLSALYRAYVVPRIGGTRQITKGVLLDWVMDTLRKSGVEAQRGSYMSDFLFDVTIRLAGHRPIVLEVLSFATQRRDWTPIEHDAGHFLYALERVEASGSALVEPPSDTSPEKAFGSYERVEKWFESAGVQTIDRGVLKDSEDLVPIIRGDLR